MAGGKLNKLERGAKKRSYGLFQDMEKLNERTEEQEQQPEISNDIEKGKELTNSVDVSKADQERTESEEIKVSTANVQNIVKEEPTVFTDDDSESRRPVEAVPEQTVAVADTKSEVLEEIFKEVSVENSISRQNASERPDASVSEAPSHIGNEPQTAAEADEDQQVAVLSSNIKSEINNVVIEDSKPQKKQNSRYEKDKFLLLDIRGYRDYIEHIAKAANMSATKYIRSLIEQDMEKNMEIYLAHKKLEERLRNKQ